MVQHLSVRVYYEDTDFSGRVYHASYLRFMERARTEWLRSRGFENLSLAKQDDLNFVVRGANLEFLVPAVMDDLLLVTARLSNVHGAVLEFEQEVLRGGQLLCSAKITIVALRGAKPVRPPKHLMQQG